MTTTETSINNSQSSFYCPSIMHQRARALCHLHVCGGSGIANDSNSCFAFLSKDKECV